MSDDFQQRGGSPWGSPPGGGGGNGSGRGPTPPDVDKIIKEFQSDLRDYKISEIDGMRLENESGWALIRASNTQPALTMRFESDSIENLNILQKYVKDKIEKAIGMKCKF